MIFFKNEMRRIICILPLSHSRLSYNDNRVAKILKTMHTVSPWKLENWKNGNELHKMENERINKWKKKGRRWPNETSNSAPNEKDNVYTNVNASMQTILTNITDVHFICNNKILS